MEKQPVWGTEEITPVVEVHPGFCKDGFSKVPTWTVEDVCNKLGLSKSKVHKLLNADEIRHVRYGSVIRIFEDGVLEYVQRCTRGGN